MRWPFRLSIRNGRGALPKYELMRALPQIFDVRTGLSGICGQVRARKEPEHSAAIQAFDWVYLFEIVLGCLLADVVVAEAIEECKAGKHDN